MEKGISYLLLIKIISDLETPISALLKLSPNQEYSFLLESVEGGETIGRWSVVASDPLWTVTIRFS